jgi:hypothetical protein
MKILIIGHTGYIGSYLYKESISKGIETVGLSSKYLEFYSGNKLTRKTRVNGPSSYEDIFRMIDCETIIINASWTNLLGTNKVSLKHLLSAEDEIQIIKKLKQLEFRRYITFGSILEFSELENERKSRYVEAKQKIQKFLYENVTNFTLLRLSTPFTSDFTGHGIISEMYRNQQLGLYTKLLHPNKYINIFSIEEFAGDLICKIGVETQNEMNIGSPIWAKLSDIRSAIYEEKGLLYIKRYGIPFGLDDPILFKVESNEILKYFKITR